MRHRHERICGGIRRRLSGGAAGPVRRTQDREKLAFVVRLSRSRALDRLGSLLARTAATSALVLAPAARPAAGAVAGVRVALRRSAWLAVGRDLVGQRVQATVERHRWALAGGSAELDLWFGEGRRIDPLVAARAEPRPVEERPALRVVSA